MQFRAGDTAIDGTPMMSGECFRGVGFDTEMWADGHVRETIFFIPPHMSDDPPGGRRLEKVSEEQAQEFISYYEHQIAVVRDYLKNGCNPNTHEWGNR